MNVIEVIPFMFVSNTIVFFMLPITPFFDAWITVARMVTVIPMDYVLWKEKDDN